MRRAIQGRSWIELVFNLSLRDTKNLDAVVRLFYSQSREKDMATGGKEEGDLMKSLYSTKEMCVWVQLRNREAALWS
jgi:hypothetical protein